MEKFTFVKNKNIFKLPKSAGVYAFKQERNFLYIGKAVNIKERVRNHFKQRNYRDNFFVNKTDKIGYIKTDSEIEALILEAKLIKKYKPKYNILWRDDKNYFYIAITKEKTPRIFITHQEFSKEKEGKEKKEREKMTYIGPFVEGSSLKKVLNFLRKVFPYYTKAKHPKGNCSWCHLNLCPGPNPDQRKYKQNIKKLVDFLRGKKKKVINELKKEMNEASKKQNFEKAAQLRDQINALEKTLTNAKIILEFPINSSQNKDKIPENLKRIEAYDVSNIQGKFATGAMVVFINGKAEKSLYRRFKIKLVKKPNDVAMLKEVLSRRFRHQEWQIPDLIIIDGGRTQLSAAKEIIEKNRIKTKIIALTKNKKHKPIKIYMSKNKKAINLKGLPPYFKNIVAKANNEAHRFAKSYHLKLREVDLFK